MKRALLLIVLLLLAAGVAPGAPALLGGNLRLGEKLLDAGSRHVASGLSSELQKGSDEVWLRRAAECFVAPGNVRAVGGSWSAEAPLNSRVVQFQNELRSNGVVSFTRADRVTLKEIGNISSGLESELAVTRIGQTRYLRLLGSHGGEVPLVSGEKFLMHTHPASGYGWGGLGVNAISEADTTFIGGLGLQRSSVANEYGWWRVFTTEGNVGPIHPNP